MHQPNDVVEFAMVHLSTNLRLHYAERGIEGGKQSSSSTRTSAHGIGSAGCSPCSRRSTTPSPRPTRARGLREAGVLLVGGRLRC